VLLAGKEKRNQQRRIREKRQYPILKTGNMVFLTALLLVLAILSVGGAYLLERQETVFLKPIESSSTNQ
jgi:hypothetical protein